MRLTYYTTLAVIACIYADSSLVDARRDNRGSSTRGGGEIRRTGPCGDGSRPVCLDGQSPSFDRETMTIDCLDLSTPMCADNSVPDFTGGRGGGAVPRASPCDDSSRPTCADGEKPVFDRELEIVLCADSSTPLCSNGSIPDFTSRQEGEGGPRGGPGGRGRGPGGRRFACPNKEKPFCGDGMRPMYSPEEMIHVCLDGSGPPLCSDGSTPSFGGGRNEEDAEIPSLPPPSSSPPLDTPVVVNGSVCPDGSLPSCSDASRPFEDVSGLLVCADGTTPVCGL